MITKFTIKNLAEEIARIEGKKSQARIGDIREILGILSDLVLFNPEQIPAVLESNGKKRLKKKKP